MFPRHKIFIAEEPAKLWLTQELKNKLNYKNIENEYNPEYTKDWKNKHAYDITIHDPWKCSKILEHYNTINQMTPNKIVIECKCWDTIGGGVFLDLYEQLQKYKSQLPNQFYCVFIVETKNNYFSTNLFELGRISGEEEIIKQFLISNGYGVVICKENSTEIKYFDNDSKKPRTIVLWSKYQNN